MNQKGWELFMSEIAASPSMHAYLEAHFQAGRGEALQRLAAVADESDFPLRQWLGALIVLGQWLDVRGMSMALDDKIGYVCCAAEACGAGSTLTDLPSMVREMLETHGCERAVKV